MKFTSDPLFRVLLMVAARLRVKDLKCSDQQHTISNLAKSNEQGGPSICQGGPLLPRCSDRTAPSEAALTLLICNICTHRLHGMKYFVRLCVPGTSSIVDDKWV